MDHEMREILHGGTPRGTLGTGVHAEALEAEGAQSPIDVVVSLNEVVDHHVVDARAKGTNRADVRHLVAHVVATHVLHDLHVAVVIPLADFASVKREDRGTREFNFQHKRIAKLSRVCLLANPTCEALSIWLYEASAPFRNAIASATGR